MWEWIYTVSPDFWMFCVNWLPEIVWEWLPTFLGACLGTWGTGILGANVLLRLRNGHFTAKGLIGSFAWPYFALKAIGFSLLGKSLLPASQGKTLISDR